jgi:methionine-rich copper-binding protein CopC
MTPIAWNCARCRAHLIFYRAVARAAKRVMCGVGALLILGAASGPAFAHAIIVRTSPPQSGVGAADIGKVEVWYDAGIRDAFVALAVVNGAGERIDKRDAAIDASDPAHVTVGVNPLTPGKYTVRYRALSADGHIVSGAWEFEIK